MGAHSTLKIRRRTAERMVMNAIYDPKFSDEIIKAAMDIILDGRLYNCYIVGDDDEHDEDRL